MKKAVIYNIRMMFLAVVLMSALSCDREFKLKGLDTHPRAFIEFLPCEEDSSMVRVFRAYPTQMMVEDITLNSFVEDAASAVSIEVDGTPVVAENYGNSLAYVHRKFNPGETVTVRVDLGDGCRAESETVIPPAIKEYRFSRSNREIVLDYSADQYPEYISVVPNYTVTMQQTGPDGETTTTVSHGGAIRHFNTTPRSDIAGEMVSRLRSLAFGQSYMYYWKDSDSEIIENGWHRMRFPIDSHIFLSNRNEYDLKNGHWVYDKVAREDVYIYEIYHIVETYDYEFHIFGIHEDLYKYMNNQLDMDSSKSEMFGLAPTVFNWTNVQGGFGIVAGMSQISTGWFRIDD